MYCIPFTGLIINQMPRVWYLARATDFARARYHTRGILFACRTSSKISTYVHSDQAMKRRLNDEICQTNSFKQGDFLSINEKTTAL